MTYLEIRDDIVSKMKRQLDESIFKKCLENLIEQGYLKRDEEARDKFHYIPWINSSVISMLLLATIYCS